MKILMITSAFPPAPSGGAEKQCLAQSLALAARGHEVTVVTEWLNRRHPRRECIGGVQVLRMGFLLPLLALALKLQQWMEGGGKPNGMEGERDAWRPSCERAVPGWIRCARWGKEWSFIAEVAVKVWTRQIEADVVHVHSSEWIAGFAHWVAEKLRVPVVCKEACGEVLRWPDRRDIPWLKCWKRRRRECAFIAITPHIRGELMKAGIAGDTIFDVPNGVVWPVEGARPGESALAIYGGNFSQGAGFKGFDVLIRAWGVARRREPAIAMHLYGAGDVESWKAMAREEGVGDSLQFAGEIADLGPVLATAGYLVLPSRVEGLSNVLLEAQAAGLPAIVSDIPGNRSVVEDGWNGLVVPAGDVAALADAIVRMHRSPEMRARMGQSARDVVRKRFDISLVAEKLEGVYSGLIQSSNSAYREPAATP